MDAVAQSKWGRTTPAARDTMLQATHTVLAPWWCVRADDKKPAPPRRDPPHPGRGRAGEGVEGGWDLEHLNPDVIFPFGPGRDHGWATVALITLPHRRWGRTR